MTKEGGSQVLECHTFLRFAVGSVEETQWYLAPCPFADMVDLTAGHDLLLYGPAQKTLEMATRAGFWPILVVLSGGRNPKLQRAAHRWRKECISGKDVRTALQWTDKRDASNYKAQW